MYNNLQTDKQIYDVLKLETERQQNKLGLIASENFVSPAVLEAAGTILTNKYAEGYPGKRYYGGCEFVDMAEDIARDHPAGLIAKGLLNSPVPYCDVVTSTTHKTLRGPRGGVILMGKDSENKFGITTPKGDRVKMMSELYDSSVMPGIQGGPLMHIIMAKAVAFGEALDDEFKTYAKQVIKNAKTCRNN